MDYDSLKDELLSIADTGLKYAASLDKSAEFEVFLFVQSDIEAGINQGVVTAKDGIVMGNAVRAARGKKVGFACGSGIDAERVRLSADEAFGIANSIDVEDERFEGFCDSGASGKEGNFAKEILELGTEELLRSCEEIIKEAQSVDERAKIISADASASWGGYAVANTRGLLLGTSYGDNGCSANVQAIEGDERKGAFEFDVTRERVFETSGLGKKAAEEAVALLGAKKLDLTTKMQTIWTPVPASLYVMSSLGQSVLGQPVVEGISPLCDRIGDRIAHEGLTVVDDGQKPSGLGTNAIDHEGNAQRRNPIIEKGVLKGFLFNTYFGRAFGVDSTGNCGRGSSPFGGSTPYESTPGVAPKWFEVSPGKSSEEDLISSVDEKAIMVKGFPLGIFHTNVSTGEFSIVAGEAYLVEKGEVKHPVQPVSIAGSFYDGFKNLTGIGNDVLPMPWGVESPALAIDGFSIVG
ncbi:MAG: TldD/PmbA family protein [Candidatus Thorarchaeota archaeon]|nr:MAG: TldD/PmbA family protein [Candidatus Thorarchaeota archaeon]